MKLTRSPRLRPLRPQFRSFKLAPLAFVGVFLFTNLTGLFFSPAFAPSAGAQAAVLSDDKIPADVPSSGDKDIDTMIYRAGQKYGVDPRFIHAVIWQESKYKTDARSHAGAQGLMQLMPDTAKRFGCKDIDDPADNIDAGTHYLRWLLERFSGDLSLALAGYNAGEGAVDKYEGVPPFDETKGYVRNIEARYGKTFHPILEPSAALVEFGLTPQVGQLSN